MSAHTKCSSPNNDSKRIAANTKERERVQRMNKAFIDLKKVLPKTASATKMDLLSSAKDYIQILTEVLQETCGKDIMPILNGHRLRKICGITTSQLFPRKADLPEAIFKFSVQGPESSIPFQGEATSSPNWMNSEKATNDFSFLSPSLLSCQNRNNQVLTNESPPETVLRIVPKSTIPFQDETVPSPNFVNQGNNIDDLGLVLGPPISHPQNYTQETTNSQNLAQPLTWNQYSSPPPVPLPNHRVPNGDTMNYSCSSKGLGVPTMPYVTPCNPLNSPDVTEIDSTQGLEPTLSDQLDQFCCELFGMIPSVDEAKSYEDFIQTLPNFPLEQT